MQLNAGPIQLQYQNGFFRTLTANGEEVLRMIYFALRDRDWQTARISITNEFITSESDSFVVDYDWQVDDLGIQMVGNNTIKGKPDGSITCEFYGQADNTFLRNRIGFCVLHPIKGLSGQPCLIETLDGQRTEAPFPDLISPHQPFLNIQTMMWQMASGQQFTITFEGDIFETEDQRNWTDASYKTYSTPLSRPFPVEVPVGTFVRQRICFKPVTLRTELSTTSTAGILADDANVITRPRIGLGQCADGLPLSDSEAAVLKTLNLSHLRADVRFTQPDWQTNLVAARRDADALNITLELALFFSQNAQNDAEEFVTFVQSNQLPLYSLALFQADNWRTTDALLTQVVPVLRAQLPNVLIGGGTDANFVDLNRHRFDFVKVDFVTYSINPQVHAFDDQTLMENTAAQADTVRSARALSGGKPVHISPVTLLPRFNPDATNAGAATPPTDPRHATAFGAEWTRQSLDTLTRAGAASVTYYETHGPRGLVNGLETFPVLAVFRGL